MSDSAHKLVSCIMPTYNRREFVPHALRYFLRQDYEPRELIIIDDGPDCIEDLIPNDPRIRYYRLPQKITLGAKLNMACQKAEGEIFINWDDDDWYAPHRIRLQVETLEREKTSICGLNHLFYYHKAGETAYQYIYPPEQRKWLLGSTLCYTREQWTITPFANIDVGMDGLFVWASPPERVTVLQDPTFAVFMIHHNNVSPKETHGAWWHPIPLEKIAQLLGDDWQYYRPVTRNEPNVKPAPHPTQSNSTPTLPLSTGINEEPQPARNLITAYPRVLPIIAKIRDIDGWLSDDEAELLIHSVRDAFTSNALIDGPSGVVMEIGSYCGKSTVLFGSVIKALGCSLSHDKPLVYAVDPFDGRVTGSHQQIMQMPATYHRFKANIKKAGVGEVVRPLICRSSEIKDWQHPIRYLFIDGLHDYDNVALDFRTFEKHLVPGGYVAFHDYADSFPGVKTFVDQLEISGKYEQIALIDSLVVLVKKDTDSATQQKIVTTVSPEKPELRIGKMILHYNTPDLTHELCRSVEDAVIVDNGSQPPITHPAGRRVVRFQENLGFTIGWNRAVGELFNQYDAFWLMNSDIQIPVETLERVQQLLTRDPSIAMLTPSFNSWVGFLTNKGTNGLREVPFMELTAPVIRKEAFEAVGFFDETFSLGYGVDFDFGYRLRQAGMKMVVDDGSSFHHTGQQTIWRTGEGSAFFKQAVGQMNRVLIEKYGHNWRDVVFAGTGFQCPDF